MIRSFLDRLVTLLVHGAFYAFPKDFRELHKADMMNLQAERHREAWRSGGVVAALWDIVRLIPNLIASGLVERINSGRSKSARGRVGWFGVLWSDILVSLRSLRRTPGFVAVAAIPMALGIAASTSVFSIVDGVFLRPLPYSEPDRIVVLGTAWPGDLASRISIPNFLDVADRATSFEGLASFRNGTFLRHTEEGLERARVGRVSSNFFQVLGVQPEIGRTFRDDDERTVVLSHAEWADRWSSDPAVVGRTIEMEVLGRESATNIYTVVGVLSRGFVPPEGLGASDEIRLWVVPPIDRGFIERTRAFSLTTAIGRLGSGVELSRAGEEVSLIGGNLVSEYPEANSRENDAKVFSITPLHELTVGDVGTRLVLLMVGVCSLLLIACANVANLFLARSDRAQHEISLRLALGSSRTRVVGQALLQSGIIAAVGGVVGVGLTFAIVSWFVSYSPGDVPRLAEITVEPRTLIFAITATGLAAMLSGLFPAIGTLGRQPGEVLRSGARTSSGRLHLTRSTLVAAELALAVVLLVVSSVTMTAFLRTLNRDLGFDHDEVITMRISAPRDQSGEASVAFFHEVVRRVNAQPGLSEATSTNFGVESSPPQVYKVTTDPGDEPVGVGTHIVMAGFFELLGIDVLRGRSFTEVDAANALPTAIVSTSFAEKYWPGEVAVGKTILIAERPAIEVVGVVADLATQGAAANIGPTVFLPYAQHSWLGSVLIMSRYSGDAGAAARGMREALRLVDQNILPEYLSTLTDDLGATVREPKFYSYLLTGFSITALLLAAVGIHATLSYMVLGRRKEIGIRMALGATHTRVVGLVLKHGMSIVAAGLIAGVFFSRLALPLVESVVIGAAAVDPDDVLVVLAVLILVSVVACVRPARHASLVEPMEVLRED